MSVIPSNLEQQQLLGKDPSRPTQPSSPFSMALRVGMKSLDEIDSQRFEPLPRRLGLEPLGEGEVDLGFFGNNFIAIEKGVEGVVFRPALSAYGRVADFMGFHEEAALTFREIENRRRAFSLVPTKGFARVTKFVAGEIIKVPLYFGGAELAGPLAGALIGPGRSRVIGAAGTFAERSIRLGVESGGAFALPGAIQGFAKGGLAGAAREARDEFVLGGALGPPLVGLGVGGKKLFGVIRDSTKAVSVRNARKTLGVGSDATADEILNSSNTKMLEAIKREDHVLASKLRRSRDTLLEAQTDAAKATILEESASEAARIESQVEAASVERSAKAATAEAQAVEAAEAAADAATGSVRRGLKRGKIGDVRDELAEVVSRSETDAAATTGAVNVVKDIVGETVASVSKLVKDVRSIAGAKAVKAFTQSAAFRKAIRDLIPEFKVKEVKDAIKGIAEQLPDGELKETLRGISKIKGKRKLKETVEKIAKKTDDKELKEKLSNLIKEEPDKKLRQKIKSELQRIAGKKEGVTEKTLQQAADKVDSLVKESVAERLANSVKSLKKAHPILVEKLQETAGKLVKVNKFGRVVIDKDAVKAASIEELAVAAQRAEKLATQGVEFRDAVNKNLEKIVDDIAEELNLEPGIAERPGLKIDSATGVPKDKYLAARAIDYLADITNPNGLLNIKPLDMAIELGGGRNSKWFEIFYKNIVDGSDDAAARFMEHANALDEFFTRMGWDSNRIADMSRRTARKGRLRTVNATMTSGAKFSEAGTVEGKLAKMKMSEGEASYVYALLKTPFGREILLAEGKESGERAGLALGRRKGRVLHFSDEQAARFMAGLERDHPELVEMSGFIIDKFGTSVRDDVAEASVRLLGENVALDEAFISVRRIGHETKHALEGEIPLADIETAVGSLKRRVGGTLPVEVMDIVDLYHRQTSMFAKLRYLQPHLKIAAKALNHKSVSGALHESKNGSKVLSYYREYFKEIADDIVGKTTRESKKDIDQINKLFLGIIGSVTRGTLGLNAYVSMMQGNSVFHASTVLDSGGSVLRMGKTASRATISPSFRREATAEMYAWSPFLKLRKLGSGSTAFVDPTVRVGAEESFRASRKFSNFAMAPIGFFDESVVIGIWEESKNVIKTKYAEQITERGFMTAREMEEAAMLAEKTVRETQPVFDTMHINLLQIQGKRRAAERAVGMFRGMTSQIVSMTTREVTAVRRANRQLKNGIINKQQKNAIVRRAAMNLARIHVAGSGAVAIMDTIRERMTQGEGFFDNRGLVSAFFHNYLNRFSGAFLFGNVLEDALTGNLNANTAAGDLSPAISVFGRAASSGTRAVFSVMDPDSKTPEAVLKGVSDVGKLAGLPGSSTMNDAVNSIMHDAQTVTRKRGTRNSRSNSSRRKGRVRGGN